jgi:hypothetical protein
VSTVRVKNPVAMAAGIAVVLVASMSMLLALVGFAKPADTQEKTSRSSPQPSTLGRWLWAARSRPLSRSPTMATRMW